MLWAAWRFGGESPHRLYHYPNNPPVAHPLRYKAFLYACAVFSIDLEASRMKASMAPMQAMAGAFGGGGSRRGR